MAHIGEETTTRSGESVHVCPERRVTGTNQEYQGNKEKREEPTKYRDCKLDSSTKASKTKDTTEENYEHANALETRSGATNPGSLIQDENQQCDEIYYNNATTNFPNGQLSDTPP